MRFSVQPVGVAALFVFAASELVSRAAADDVDTCVKGAADEAIAASTHVISSGRWQSRNLAWAYDNRGDAYRAKGDTDRAMSEYNEAIELDPKYAYAALWVDIAGQRNSVPSRLSQAISPIDMTAWPAPVIRRYLGQMIPAAVHREFQVAR